MLRTLRRWYRRAFPTRLPDGETLRTSVTLEYRKEAWGLERIVLDAVSNHLPSDSGGLRTHISWKSGDAWRDDDLPQQGRVGAIRVSDDGNGYDLQLLDLLHSTKRDNETIGQFGEGLKLVAAACLREGYDLELRSRDWLAIPFIERTKVDGERIDRVCFRVARAQYLDGSATIFRNPDTRLVQEFRTIPQRMLHFAPAVRVLYEGSRCDGVFGNRILELEGAARVFVRGVLVRNAIGGRGGLDALFSYDLDTNKIGPDRQLVDMRELRVEIGALLLECADQTVQDRLFTAASRTDRHALLEIESIGAYAPHINSLDVLRRLWRRAFTRRYGKNALLASDDQTANGDANMLGYEVVRLQDGFARFLSACGVQRTNDLRTSERRIWTDPASLCAAESRALAEIPRLHEYYALGEMPPIRVYDRIDLIRKDRFGKEMVSQENVPIAGQHVSWADGRKEVLIARQVLSDRERFVHVYLHEMIHHRTDAADYTREYARGAIDLLTQRYLADNSQQG